MSATLTFSERVPATAHAVTLVRGMPDGSARSYSMAWFPKAKTPWNGVELFVRRATVFGWLTDADEKGWYGCLDVLDEATDIVETFGVPDARAFQGIKRKLGLTVEHTEGDESPASAPVETREDD